MASKLRSKGLVIDRRTGRKRRVNQKLSRAAKRGARSRLHKKRSAKTRHKISIGLRKTNRRGRTMTGRRVIARRRVSRAPKFRTKVARRARISASPIFTFSNR